MGKGFSFGVVRSEQTRLRGFGGTAGAVCLGLLSGDAVAVGRVLDNQIERQWREEKLMLRNGQAASVAFHGGCSFAANLPGKRWDICRAGQSKCRCETGRTGAAKPAASGSNESQAVKAALSHCAAASAQIEAKPTCRQPGTIPKNAAFRDRATPKLALSGVTGCKTVAENQSDAVVLNCWFLKPTMAGHSPVLTLQFLNVLFS
jgi:hypothetical protein